MKFQKFSVFLCLFLMGCNEFKAKLSNESQSHVLTLSGDAWTTDCDNGNRKHRMLFLEEGRWEKTIDMYPDNSACQGSIVYTIVGKGIYEVKGSSLDVSGAQEVDSITSDLIMIPRSQTAVSLMNSIPECAGINWVVGISRSLNHTACLSSSGQTIEFPSNTSYTIMRKTTNTLELGSSNACESPCNDGKTQATRIRTFEPRAYYPSN